MRAIRGAGAWLLVLAAAGCDILLGINKDYHPLGGGGAGGVIEPSPRGKLGEPCTPTGALGCAEVEPKSKLICGPDGRWVTNNTCDGDTRCDGTAGPDQGTCKSVLAGCEEKAAEDTVCVDLTRVKCGPDLLGGGVVETCPFVCIDGACSGECVPQAKGCMGSVPRSCDEDGLWQNEMACSPSTEICVAGACMNPPSCAAGLSTCGGSSAENCCEMESVPGGTYDRSNDPLYTATVSGFRLDRFEITVGRFRAFVEAYPGNKPKADAGAHPVIPGSGWDASWNGSLPVDQVALKSVLKCSGSYDTWTDAPAGNENLPMNCMTWFDAFAFCAWDGGRLPTEAEWNYAAAGGDEQRMYPWGNSPVPDKAHAVYYCTGDGSAEGDCVFADILKVGSKPMGYGKWGQADLAGGMLEWVLDWHAPYATPCNDCANLQPASNRVLRGGSWFSYASFLLPSVRVNYSPSSRTKFIGARCARIP